MKADEVQFLVEFVERASLGNLFYHGRKAEIERTVSIRLLRRLCKKRALANAKVAWVAFSAGLDTERDWHLSLITPIGEDIAVDEVVAPACCEDLSKVAAHEGQLGPDFLINEASLSQEWRAWGPMASHQVKALSVHEIGQELEQEIGDLMAGWVVFAYTEPQHELGSGIRDELRRAYKDLLESLRVLAAARPSDTRLLSLAGFDGEGFGIGRLERPGEIVDCIKVGEEATFADSRVLGEGPWFSEAWYSKNRTVLTRGFAECVRQGGLKGVGNVDLGERLTDFQKAHRIPKETFIGIVESSGGHAVLDLADSKRAIIGWMLRLSRDQEKYDGVEMLVIAVPSGLEGYFQEQLGAWDGQPRMVLFPVECDVDNQEKLV